MSDRMWLETWDQMTLRHDMEKRELIQSLSDGGYTLEEAASILKKPSALIDAYAKRYKITLGGKNNGRANREPEN